MLCQTLSQIYCRYVLLQTVGHILTLQYDNRSSLSKKLQSQKKLQIHNSSLMKLIHKVNVWKGTFLIKTLQLYYQWYPLLLMSLCNSCFHCQTSRLHIIVCLDSQQNLKRLYLARCNPNQSHSLTEITHIDEQDERADRTLGTRLYYEGHYFVSERLKTPQEKAVLS